MKRTMGLGIALLLAILTTPSWTHHAAEGIISDELWTEIDDRLEASGSPHLIIFEDVMGSMRVDDADGHGSMFLVSSITVNESACPDYLSTILEVLDDVTLEWMHDAKGNQAGDYSNTWLPVLIPEECDCLDDECTLSIYEPIGSVCWTDDPNDVYYRPETPGPGKGGR